MSDSVYAALQQKRPGEEPKILFLQRSDGQWWLPGGKIVSGTHTPTQAIRSWLNILVTYRNGELNDAGMWHLTLENGGGKVHLFEGCVERPDRIQIQDRSSGLTRSLAWFDRLEIHNRLHHYGDMPWGQGKMAVYSLHALGWTDHRADGDLLRSDLGVVGDMLWIRPE